MKALFPFCGIMLFRDVVRLGAKLNILIEFCTMKVIDLVKFSGDMLKQLHNFGIRMDDYRYLPMLSDYEQMKSAGEKTTYIIAVLSARYSLSERKIYKVLSRMHRDCQNSAV